MRPGEGSVGPEGLAFTVSLHCETLSHWPPTGAMERRAAVLATKHVPCSHRVHQGAPCGFWAPENGSTGLKSPNPSSVLRHECPATASSRSQYPVLSAEQGLTFEAGVNSALRGVHTWHVSDSAAVSTHVARAYTAEDSVSPEGLQHVPAAGANALHSAGERVGRPGQAGSGQAKG